MTRFRIALTAAGMLALAGPAAAQNLYVGEIILAPFGFCPAGTLEANGRMLPRTGINMPVATYMDGAYGPDRDGSFPLPDLRGRGMVNQGQGNGLSNYALGARAGADAVVLTEAQLPPHTHDGFIMVSTNHANTHHPTNAALTELGTGTRIYKKGSATAVPDVDMAPGSAVLLPTGQNAPMPVRDPFIAFTPCIAIVGVYPPAP